MLKKNVIVATRRKVAEGVHLLADLLFNLRASVRPIITYIFVFILLVVDFVGLYWAIKSGHNMQAMHIVFSNEEMAILASIIGFWFGSRHWEK